MLNVFFLHQVTLKRERERSLRTLLDSASVTDKWPLESETRRQYVSISYISMYLMHIIQLFAGKNIMHIKKMLSRHQNIEDTVFLSLIHLQTYTQFKVIVVEFLGWFIIMDCRTYFLTEIITKWIFHVSKRICSNYRLFKNSISMFAFLTPWWIKLHSREEKNTHSKIHQKKKKMRTCLKMHKTRKKNCSW